MLKIRLKPGGKIKNIVFEICVMKNLTKRNGKVIAKIGYYNPKTKLANINILLLYRYISYGAYPTARVRNIVYTVINKREVVTNG